MTDVDADQIADGLGRLGLGAESTVVAHASLRSFGHVDGGAGAVVEALTRVCGTVLMMAGASDLTAVPAPPGLVRPDNAYGNAASWHEFDDAVAAATPYRADLPADRWVGAVAEHLRRVDGARRGPHPLYSFVAVGERADDLIVHERPDDQLGPLRRLAELDGDVVLLGVDHASNTTIHLAEQGLGRGLFYRYARDRSGLWTEVPNVSGESHCFDRIAPSLAPYTVETVIGDCRARRVPVRRVLDVATELITADPRALLCDDPGCRCGAAARQLTDGG